MIEPHRANAIAGQRLSAEECALVEDVLDMGSGYCLDFSDRTIKLFFAEHQVDIDEQRFRDGPTASKANRVRSFLRQTPVPLVGQVMAALLNRRAKTQRISEEKFSAFLALAVRFGADAGNGPPPAAASATASPPTHPALWALPGSGTFTLPPSTRTEDVLQGIGVGPVTVSHTPTPTGFAPRPQAPRPAVYPSAPTTVSPPPPESPSTVSTPVAIQLFISHAAVDEQIAAALLEFIEASVELPEGSIRCTSVHGYKHPTGTRTSDALLAELEGAACVVGLLTATSAESQWVLFELGARWGLKLPVSPVLHPAFKFDDLPGALKGTQAVKLDDEHGLAQLVDDIGRATKCTRRATAKMLAAAKKLVAFAKALPSTGGAGSAAADGPKLPARAIDRAKIATLMRNYHNNNRLPVPEQVRALLALGDHEGVLSTVLMEQEKLVREEVRAAPGPYGPYDRTYMRRLSHLVVDVVEEDPEASRSVLVAYGSTLHKRLRDRGIVYLPEFHEQTLLFATELDSAYGKKCTAILRPILTQAPGVKSELTELWGQYATVDDPLPDSP